MSTEHYTPSGQNNTTRIQTGKSQSVLVDFLDCPLFHVEHLGSKLSLRNADVASVDCCDDGLTLFFYELVDNLCLSASVEF